MEHSCKAVIFLNIKFCMNENENINAQSPFLDILDNKARHKKDAHVVRMNTWSNKTRESAFDAN